MKAEEMAKLLELVDEWQDMAQRQCAMGKRNADEGARGFGMALSLAAEHLATRLDGMCVEAEVER